MGGSRDTDADAGGEFLIPLAFDPSESQSPSPHRQSQQPQEESRDRSSQLQSGDSSIRVSRDAGDASAGHPPRTSSDQPSPHIAYQEKGRERGENDASRGELEKANGSAVKAPTPNVEPESGRSSRADVPITVTETSAFSYATSHDRSRSKDVTGTARPSHELRGLHEQKSTDSARSQPTSNLAYPPKRGDSLETKVHAIPRKEVGSSPSSSAYAGSPNIPDSVAEMSKQNISSVTTPLGGAGSPSLPQYSGGSEFSADEDLARLISEEPAPGQTNESFLRRMSNSVRHGRSFSDRSIRAGKEGRSVRSPTNGSITGTDIASPTVSTSQAEEIAWLRTELRKERQRAAEMESVYRATADVKLVNTELSEKRSTMVVLDAQREIVLRELTVLTDHLEAEKRGAAGGPLDLGKLSNTVLRELAESIKKLKESYAPQIEELIQKRNDLNEEIANMTTQKEKTFQEFEQLSSKNAQLAELNNQLVHQIQELYKSTPDGHRAPNGLGIVSHNKDRSIHSLEGIRPAGNDLAASVSTAHITDDEPTTATATVVPGPQVVSIRKGQPRKFNWKKGGQNVAKGVKGLKGAFMSSENAENGNGFPRSQTQDPTRQGFGFFGNQRNKQGGKMSQADSVPVLNDTSGNSTCPQGLCRWWFLNITNNSQLSSVLISRLVWNMRKASFPPSLPGVSKKWNCEVRPLTSNLQTSFLSNCPRYGYGRHLPKIWCRLGYTRHS